MRASSLDMTAEVHIATATEPNTAQLTAWRRLWALLLTGDGATSGELAAREDAGNG